MLVKNIYLGGIGQGRLWGEEEDAHLHFRNRSWRDTGNPNKEADNMPWAAAGPAHSTWRSFWPGSGQGCVNAAQALGAIRPRVWVTSPLTPQSASARMRKRVQIYFNCNTSATHSTSAESPSQALFCTLHTWSGDRKVTRGH